MTAPDWHPSRFRGQRNARWYGAHWIRDAKRQAIYTRDGFRCIWCGPRSDNLVLTLDHLIPVVHGGGNHSTNLACCCWRDNMARQARSVHSYLRWLEKAGEDVDAIAVRLQNIVESPIDYPERACRVPPRRRRGR